MESPLGFQAALSGLLWLDQILPYTDEYGEHTRVKYSPRAPSTQ